MRDLVEVILFDKGHKFGTLDFVALLVAEVAYTGSM